MLYTAKQTNQMEFKRLIRLTLLILILVNQADELFCVKFGVFFTLKVHMMTTKELLIKMYRKW